MTDKKPSPSEKILASRRAFMQKAGLGGVALGASALAAPAVVRAQVPLLLSLEAAGQRERADALRPRLVAALAQSPNRVALDDLVVALEADAAPLLQELRQLLVSLAVNSRRSPYNRIEQHTH